jgi:hypothetical protein
MTTTTQADAMSTDVALPTQWDMSLETLAPGVGQLIESQQGHTESWYDALARLLPVMAATYQQKQLLSVQVERARQGLPPLDVSNYAPGVNVGLDEKTQRLLIIGGVVALAVLAYGTLRRR